MEDTTAQAYPKFTLSNPTQAFEKLKSWVVGRKGVSYIPFDSLKTEGIIAFHDTPDEEVCVEWYHPGYDGDTEVDEAICGTWQMFEDFLSSQPRDHVYSYDDPKQRLKGAAIYGEKRIVVRYVKITAIKSTDSDRVKAILGSLKNRERSEAKMIVESLKSLLLHLLGGSGGCTHVEGVHENLHRCN